MTKELKEHLLETAGRACFLCGKLHSTGHTMAVDHVDPANKTDASAFLACKACVRQRRGKPLGAYLKERFVASHNEHEHIREMAQNGGYDVLVKLP